MSNSRRFLDRALDSYVESLEALMDLFFDVLVIVLLVLFSPLWAFGYLKIKITRWWRRK